MKKVFLSILVILAVTAMQSCRGRDKCPGVGKAEPKTAAAKVVVA